MLITFQEISYSELLEPSYERKDPPQQPIDSEADFIPVSELTGGALSCQGEQELGAGAWGAAVGAPYSPHLLDGWLGAGKHRTFLTFPSYIVSKLNIKTFTFWQSVYRNTETFKLHLIHTCMINVG